MCTAKAHQRLKDSWSLFERSTVLPAGREPGMTVHHDGHSIFLALRDCPLCGSSLGFVLDGGAGEHGR